MLYCLIYVERPKSASGSERRKFKFNIFTALYDLYNRLETICKDFCEKIFSSITLLNKQFLVQLTDHFFLTVKNLPSLSFFGLLLFTLSVEQYRLKSIFLPQITVSLWLNEHVWIERKPENTKTKSANCLTINFSTNKPIRRKMLITTDAGSKWVESALLTIDLNVITAEDYLTKKMSLLRVSGNLKMT